MKDVCEWCSSQNVAHQKERVFWELPDGTRTIEIIETPSIVCHDCQILYQTEKVVKEIENQLFLINTKHLGKKISYDELMIIPKLLKKNYFDI